MDKVKLPKEVAEELQARRNEGWSDFRIISIIYQDWQAERHTTPISRFADQNSSPFLRALADGYEVEETPEDKVRTLYNRFVNSNDNDDFDEIYASGAIAGIKLTLEALGKWIEGVNT